MSAPLFPSPARPPVRAGEGTTPAPSAPPVAGDAGPVRSAAGGEASADRATPRVVGLDLSLTSTGWADRVTCGRFRPKSTGHQRLEDIRSEVESVTAAADLVVLEGPSFGSKGNALHQLGGLWWLIAHDLWGSGLPYAVVSPQARAKYATGNGGAGKDEVLATAVRRFPDIDIRGNDEADAVVLAAMGYDHLGDPMVRMPQTHRVALDKVDWPEVRTR